MLIVFEKNSGTVVSISGFREMVPTPEQVDSIQLAEPLSEDQAEYRVYDAVLMEKIWDAHDEGREVRVVISEEGVPIDVYIEEPEEEEDPLDNEAEDDEG